MPAITALFGRLRRPSERRFRLYETIANVHQFSVLHTFVALTLCYHLLFSPEMTLNPEMRNILILVLLVTTATIWRVPPRYFGKGWFVGSWILGDTFVALAVVFLSGQSGSGLYVAFFLLILLAAFAQSLKQTLMLSAVLCGGYGGILYLEGEIQSLSLEEDRLLQIPLLLIVATFYGHALELLRKGRAQQWALIGERRRSEDALNESRERYRSLVEAATDAILVTDKTGSILSWNRGAERIFSYQLEEIRDKPLAFLFSEPPTPDLPAGSEPGWPPAVGHTIEGVGRRRDGSAFPMELSSNAWDTPQGTWYGCIIRDVTERKRSERVQAEMEAQKQEALRRMAGGIANDFNNLLTVIMGYCEMLLTVSEPDRTEYKHVQEIRKAGTRATELARQLLLFSRRYMIEMQLLDLNEVLAEMEPRFRQVLGETIELVIVNGPALGRVQAHPDHLAEAVLNLLANAREAMPAGGRLSIETANALVEEAPTGAGEVRPGRYVRLTISDTGCVMDAETQAQIFDPFFTTKQPGRRSGMGLSAAYGIFKQIGGHISVQSELQQGTTFTIHLPQVERSR